MTEFFCRRLGHRWRPVNAATRFCVRCGTVGFGTNEGFTSGPDTPAWPGVVIAAVAVAGLIAWWLA